MADSTLTDLCHRYTGLTDDQILILEDLADHLPLFAELTTDNVFIDCLVDETKAVVVAEAEPTQSTGLYGRSVIGEMALIDKEPAVFHAFKAVMPICDLKGITQENKAVRQNVIPIKDPDGCLIAVLIREKDISRELQQEKKYQELARWHQEEDLSTRALTENKEELLEMREIHHRIKNNLQLVSSILNLQALTCQDETASAILQDGISRIHSISAIHEILVGQADEQSYVSIRSLLDRLIHEIRDLYETGDEIRIILSGDDLELTLHAATSVAIVVNELLTNSLKYAFKEKESGTVIISVLKGSQFHTVTVKDDGCGFDPAMVSPDSLGLELIRNTVKERLGGILHVFSDENGTRVSFDFSG